MSLRNVQVLMKETMMDASRDVPTGMFAEGGIAIPARLKVYRNNIIGSLTNIMAETFPLVRKLVGEDFFKQMAQRFITAHPPQRGYLSHYGVRFDDFVRRYEPARTLPYLSDVAAYEIALNDAYYAEDDEALTAHDLIRVAPNTLPDVTLKLRGGTRFIQSTFPLTTIRAFCEKPEGTLDIRTGGEKLMISRPHLEVVTTKLDDTEWDVLTALTSGSIRLEEIIQHHPGLDFEKFLQKHLECGTFRAV